MDLVQNHLNHIFHHDTFQKGQEAIIYDVLNGEDVLGVLPTGSGKSLCYQLPATILPGLTVVISPLISLMIDQVRQIKAYHFKQVAALHSFQPLQERNSILTHLLTYKLLFLSPELLQQEGIIYHLKQKGVSLLCIDEAHCISQWGYDFRPDYLRLHRVIKELNSPVILALTGTATEAIQQDIKKQLGRSKMKEHIHSMEKKNISFAVERLTCSESEKMERLADYAGMLKKPALIYFSSRNKAEELAAYLTTRQKSARIAYYHAGMQAEDRLKVQEQFIHDQLDIICCTSAFGMGINKENIRTVVHYHPPAQLESFLQEVGRAGRDGNDSLSLVLYRESDVNVPLSMIENELPEQAELSFVFRRLKELQAEGEQLPATDEACAHLFQLSETKWRLLRYQLERHQLIQNGIVPFNQQQWQQAFRAVLDFCEDRKQYKREKMNEMFRWLKEEGCLRRRLYASFQEAVISKAEKCCSNCGLQESDFQAMDEVLTAAEKNSWQHQLKRILLIEENTYAKSK